MPVAANIADMSMAPPPEGPPRDSSPKAAPTPALEESACAAFSEPAVAEQEVPVTSAPVVPELSPEFTLESCFTEPEAGQVDAGCCDAVAQLRRKLRGCQVDAVAAQAEAPPPEAAPRDASPKAAPTPALEESAPAALSAPATAEEEIPVISAPVVPELLPEFTLESCFTKPEAGQVDDQAVVAQAEALGDDTQSRPKVPLLTLTLTRLPEELPPQLRPDWEVDVGVLGEGAYAAVQRLRHRQTGELVAMKVVEKHPLLIRNMLPQLQREVGIQGRLQHRHLLRLLNCVEDETHIYMLLEYCAGGSLRSIVAPLPDRRLPEANAAYIFAQVLLGVEFMHQCAVVHRDLKHDNVLMTATGEVRVCDFGWSAEVQVERALLTTCGTPNFWAPEIFENQPQGFHTDLWMLGNLVYEMLVGHEPFWGTTEELRFKVLSVDLRFPPDLLSQEAVNLFYCLLQRDPRHRVPAHRLLTEHPWVLPAVAHLHGQQGITPVVQQPEVPLGHATFQCVSVDAPIATSIDVSGPFSFYPPVPQQEAVVPETSEPQTPTERLQGEPACTEAVLDETKSESSETESVHLAVAVPNNDIADDAPVEADLRELSPTSTAALARNSDSPPIAPDAIGTGEEYLVKDSPPIAPDAIATGEDKFCTECSDPPTSIANDIPATSDTHCETEEPSISTTEASASREDGDEPVARVMAPRPKEGDLVVQENEVDAPTQQDPMLGGA